MLTAELRERLEENTALLRGPLLASTVIANLPALVLNAPALPSRAVDAHGGVAVIAGAGPSLVRALEVKS